jgi:undecaprenyl-diphosphatase
MSNNTTTASEDRKAEVHGRFARLRRLRYDHGLRRRLLLGAGAVALLVVAGLATVTRLFTVLPLDVWFTRGVQDDLWYPMTWAMYVVSLVGYAHWSALVVAAGSLLAGGLFGWRDGAYLFVISVVQGLINSGIKLLIGRPRPIDDLVDVFAPVAGFSFPSGHVTFYTVFFGFVVFLLLARMPRGWLRWVLALPAAAMVALVGPSRIILGAHWLSDVVAAYLLGFSLLALAIELYVPRLLPPTPVAEGGMVGAYDERAAQDG